MPPYMSFNGAEVSSSSDWSIASVPLKSCWSFFWNPFFLLGVFDVSAAGHHFDILGDPTWPTKTTQPLHPTLWNNTTLLVKRFPLRHTFSSCPRALLCQTCAALLKSWIINVHKHIKCWRATALKLAPWRCIGGDIVSGSRGKYRLFLGKQSAHGKESDY